MNKGLLNIEGVKNTSFDPLLYLLDEIFVTDNFTLDSSNTLANYYYFSRSNFESFFSNILQSSLKKENNFYLILDKEEKPVFEFNYSFLVLLTNLRSKVNRNFNCDDKGLHDNLLKVYSKGMRDKVPDGLLFGLSIKGKKGIEVINYIDDYFPQIKGDINFFNYKEIHENSLIKSIASFIKSGYNDAVNPSDYFDSQDRKFMEDNSNILKELKRNGITLDKSNYTSYFQINKKIYNVEDIEELEKELNKLKVLTIVLSCYNRRGV